MITRQTVQWLIAGLMLICSLVHGATAQDGPTLPVPPTEQEIGPVIDVWYSPQQSFGEIGMPISLVNILGRVSSPFGVAGLFYSLNGSVELPLSIGPDGLRLARPGDFNVELELKDLLDGLNTLVIRAVDVEGNESTAQVDVSYTDGTAWPENYAIDWSTVMSIQDVAQVLDGLWDINAEGLRPLQTDYDRLVAIGDRTWENYQVEVSVRINGIDPRAFETSSHVAAVGVLLRWPGHADWDAQRPRIGWWPHGAIGLLSWTGTKADHVTSIQIFGAQQQPWVLKNQPREIVVGATYIYKMTVQTLHGLDGGLIGSLYRLKIWEQGQAEPGQWDLTATEGPDDPQFGSLLLLSHFVDCVFGNVTVTSLPGR